MVIPSKLMLSLDISRAEQEFGFKAEMDFEEGLRRTIEWYDENT